MTSSQNPLSTKGTPRRGRGFQFRKALCHSCPVSGTGVYSDGNLHDIDGHLMKCPCKIYDLLLFLIPYPNKNEALASLKLTSILILYLNQFPGLPCVPFCRNRPDDTDEFLFFIRLGDITVGTELYGFLFVLLTGARCEHHDRDV